MSQQKTIIQGGQQVFYFKISSNHHSYIFVNNRLLNNLFSNLEVQNTIALLNVTQITLFKNFNSKTLTF
jgi:hypothetical protein